MPLELLKRYVSENSLIKHCIAVAAIMREVARELNEDEETWWKLGLLHDIDFELTKGEMSKHRILGEEILVKESFSEIAELVKRHNHTLFGNYEKPVEVTLQAADSISGIIIACALVKYGRISELTSSPP